MKFDESIEKIQRGLYYSRRNETKHKNVGKRDQKQTECLGRFEVV